MKAAIGLLILGILGAAAVARRSTCRSPATCREASENFCAAGATFSSRGYSENVGWAVPTASCGSWWALLNLRQILAQVPPRDSPHNRSLHEGKSHS